MMFWRVLEAERLVSLIAGVSNCELEKLLLKVCDLLVPLELMLLRFAIFLTLFALVFGETPSFLVLLHPGVVV